MKAVIYARKSASNQEGITLEEQLCECQDYAKRNDIEVVGEYIEEFNVLCHTQKIRYAMQKLMVDCKQKSFDMVIVFDSSYFSRCFYEMYYYLNELKQEGISVVSAKEYKNNDFTPVEEIIKNTIEKELL